MAKPKHWINGAVSHPGALTREAHRHHMTVSEFITDPPANISATTRRRINLAKEFRKMHQKHHKK